MNIVLQRDASQEDCMLGDLFCYEGDEETLLYSCYTLEDEKRDVKKMGETAIPFGRYEITLRPNGDSRLDESYGQRYGFFKGQLWLKPLFGGEITDKHGDVFTYIYIHTGNTDDHTDGCILVGKTKYADTIGKSRAAYRELYPVIAKAMDEGERVFIEILDAED